MNKNVYFTSTSHSDLFPKNSRSSFNCQIDENEFHYFDRNNISAAIKSITFDNNFNTYEPKFGHANMVIIQNHHNQDDTKLNYDGLFPDISIDVKSGKDYYLFSDGINTDNGERRFAEGKNVEVRSFTDVKIFCDEHYGLLQGESFDDEPHPYRYTIHNIYFHPAGFSTGSELISYLNYVFQNIEYDVTSPIVSSSNVLFEDVAGFTMIYMNNETNLDIYLPYDLILTLGFSVYQFGNDDYPASLRDLAENNLLRKTDTEPSNVYLSSKKIFADKFIIGPYIAGCSSSNVRANEILDMELNSEYYPINKYNDRTEKFFSSHWQLNLGTMRPEILGLRTNLKSPDIFKNSVYDTQVEFINVKDHPQGVQIHEVKNPIFFETTIEKISNANFELIDIDSGKLPNFSAGTPTYVYLLVNNNPKMSKRFNIFLDSSDQHSKRLFPSNSPNDFTIKLPERLEFDKKWSITLKKIFIGNDLYNIYRDSCWFEIDVLRIPGYNDELNIENEGFYVRDKSTNTILYELDHFKETFQLPDMRIKNITDLCSLIQSMFDEKNLKLNIMFENERVCFKIAGESEDDTYQFKSANREFTVKLSPNLANILGFDKSGSGIDKFKFHVNNEFKATYLPNVNFLAPTNFIVLCDVVSESVFGNKSIKILKFLSTSFDPTKDIIDFSFYQDEFVDLNIREFQTMRIQLVDATGNLTKSANYLPTRCQVEFVKNEVT